MWPLMAIRIQARWTMILDFDKHGMLPPGDYELTFDQLRASVLVVGPSSGASHWMPSGDLSWWITLR
jgi:hypothetical protein